MHLFHAGYNNEIWRCFKLETDITKKFQTGQFEAIIKHVEMKLEFHLRSKNHETAGANGSWRCLDSLLFQKISKIPFYGNIKSHIKGYLLSIDWNLWGSLLSVCAVEDKGGISPFAFLDDGSLLGKCQHPSWKWYNHL